MQEMSTVWIAINHHQRNVLPFYQWPFQANWNDYNIHGLLTKTKQTENTDRDKMCKYMSPKCGVGCPAWGQHALAISAGRLRGEKLRITSWYFSSVATLTPRSLRLGRETYRLTEGEHSTTFIRESRNFRAEPRQL